MSKFCLVVWTNWKCEQSARRYIFSHKWFHRFDASICVLTAREKERRRQCQWHLSIAWFDIANLITIAYCKLLLSKNCNFVWKMHMTRKYDMQYIDILTLIRPHTLSKSMYDVNSLVVMQSCFFLFYSVN